jgi:hypothetical protein
MGHAGIQVTLDRYGHLMPGSHQEGADLLDAYLATQRDQAEEKARSAEPVATGTIPGTQVGEEVH